jgi:sulfatase maturation enzyme AslB (radical SAM superfamily)
MSDTTRTTIPRCLAPFTSLAIWADGESVICCEDKGPLAGHLGLVGDMSELVNSDTMRSARKQFMRGQVPEGCRVCLDEATRQPTVHNYYSDHFRWEDIAGAYDEATGTVDQTQYLLIALGNLCTYACRMCFDKLSTRLSSDRHRMLGTVPVGYQRNDIDKVISFIRANPIRVVTFHGGNPINEPRFLDVLAELPSEARVEIISNGSTLTCGNTDIRASLARFRQVHFNISLDGTRRTTEYVRVHSSFDDVFQHFTDVRALPNVTVNLHNTITNLNLFDLPAYYTMALSGTFADADSISSYIATVPAVHRVTTLPPELRQLARDHLEDYLRVLGDATGPAPSDAPGAKRHAARTYVRNVLHRLDSAAYDPHLFAQFLDLTRRTDAFYGFEPLPEYSYYLAASAGGPSGSGALRIPNPSTPAGGAVQPGGAMNAPVTSESQLAAGPCPYTGERRFARSECTFGWTAAFQQNCTAVTVRVRLVPDAGITEATMATLRTRWETGIENKWSNRFVCTGPYGNSTITFDVQFVTSNAHHNVRVIAGSGQTNMTNWHTTDSGDLAAHEFGHMIGNQDEYFDANCPNRDPVNTGTVMDNNVGGALQRHVDRICSSTPLSAEHFSIGLNLI